MHHPNDLHLVRHHKGISLDTEKQISAAVVAPVKSADPEGLAKEYAEVDLDSVLSEGVLRGIPVVSTLVAAAKVGISIHDRIFAKKLIRFLTSIGDRDPSVRASMLDRLDSEEGFRHRVGDRIIELVDRVDSRAKPEMVAKAFRAYAAQQIDMLNRLNHAIEILPHYDIERVRQFHDSTNEQRHEIPMPTLGALVAAGLANPTSGWGAVGYEPTVVCKAFISIGLDR